MNLVNKNNLYLCYENVLSAELNRQLFELAVKKLGKFEKSGYRMNENFPDWRKSRVIYHWEFKEFYNILRSIIKKNFLEIRESLGIERFEVNKKIEMQLTVHNDGDYYKQHTDNSSPDTALRVVTFVYYFHLLPKSFNGGELELYPGATNSITLEPLNNTLVIFNSSLRHEVKPVLCPSMRFENGRFTLNGWVRKKMRDFEKNKKIIPCDDRVLTPF